MNTSSGINRKTKTFICLLVLMEQTLMFPCFQSLPKVKKFLNNVYGGKLKNCPWRSLNTFCIKQQTYHPVQKSDYETYLHLTKKMVS